MVHLVKIPTVPLDLLIRRPNPEKEAKRVETSSRSTLGLNIQEQEADCTTANG